MRTWDATHIWNAEKYTRTKQNELSVWAEREPDWGIQVVRKCKQAHTENVSLHLTQSETRRVAASAFLKSVCKQKRSAVLKWAASWFSNDGEQSKAVRKMLARLTAPSLTKLLRKSREQRKKSGNDKEQEASKENKERETWFLEQPSRKQFRYSSVKQCRQKEMRRKRQKRKSRSFREKNSPGISNGLRTKTVM